MQRSNAKLFMMGSAIALSFPCIAIAASQNPPSAPVTVVNQASNPVPITGAVTSTVSGSVQVSNGVNNPIPVTGAVITVDPSAPGRQPLMLSCVGQISFDTIFCSTTAVPAGKRMVVQSLATTLTGDNNNGTLALGNTAVRVFLSGSLTGIDLFLPITAVGIINRSYPVWTANQPMFFTVEAGQTMSASIDSLNVTGTPQVQLKLFILGYLIDA